MVRLILLLLLASPAGAACFGPNLPEKVKFDSGRTVEILGHTAQDVTYRVSLPDGAPSVSTARFGIFPLITANHGTTFSYDWQSELADPRLQPLGKTLPYDADQSVEHATRSHFHTEVTRLRDEVVHLGDCSYPVHVIAKADRLDGKLQATTTLWLTDMMIPLRTEVRGDKVNLTFVATSMQ